VDRHFNPATWIEREITDAYARLIAGGMELPQIKMLAMGAAVNLASDDRPDVLAFLEGLST
jgi:hypothetical protein